LPERSVGGNDAGSEISGCRHLDLLMFYCH
jgi:hypothetical protein